MFVSRVLIPALLLPSAALGALEIPLVIDEPAGVSRVSEPVTAGIPLPGGTQTERWALFDGEREVPVQIQRLPGRTPWLLLDFQVSVGAGGRKTLVLKEAAQAAAPATPLAITENSGSVTVVTGPLKVRLQTDTFNLLDIVWYDADGDGNFTGGEETASASGDQLRLIDATTGKAYSGRGTPSRVEWEYRGPLRATLRIDGEYRNGGEALLGYTTRLTFFAGRTDIRVEHILRNSDPVNERHVKIRSATLTFGGSGQSLRAEHDTAWYWASAGDQGLAFEIVPRTMNVSYVGDAIDVDGNGGWVLPDLTHHGVELTVDFARGLSSAERVRRAAAAKSPLFAIAPPAWYSEYGELSTTRFSTLEDERQAYRLWGWTWDRSQEPSDAHKPGWLVYWWPAIHEDTEADDLWQNLLMYLRTASRGYWDRTRGWAWYFKHRNIFRTDGFSYSWHVSNRRGTGRPLIEIPLTEVDRKFLEEDVRKGKVDIRAWGGCHMWGWGLVDYYYLTGDRDALDAAQDLAECVERTLGGATPGIYKGSPDTGYNVWDNGVRKEARQLLLACRVYEATQDPRWGNLMEHVAQLFLQSSGWDPRGTFTWPRSGFEKTVSSMHFAFMGQAFERYWRITGNPEMRERLIDMARFAKSYGLHPTWQYTGYYFVLDYPEVGQTYHINFDNGGLAGFAPNYTYAWVDSLVRGFRLTGDRSFLEYAKFCWHRGSKTRYGKPELRTAGDNEVGRFLNNKFMSNGWMYPYNGDMHFAHLLFRDFVHPQSAPDDVAQQPIPDAEPEPAPAPQQQEQPETAEVPLPEPEPAPRPQQDPVVVERVEDSSERNSVLLNLPDNTWVYLNPKPSLRYIPVFKDPAATNALTQEDRVERREPVGRAYTGIVYGHGRLFYFGGGHNSYPGNDVEVYSISENVWSQSYKPEVPPPDDPVYGAGGSPNRSPLGRPFTIHGYSRTTYDPLHRVFLCTASQSLAAYDPGNRTWRWLAGKYAPNAEPPMPNIADLTQFDNALGGILGIGRNTIWLFKDGEWRSHDTVPVRLAGIGGSASCYIPDLQSHLFAVMPQGGCCDEYAQGHLYLYNSVKKTLREITSVPAAVRDGFYPQGNFVMAYDTANKRVVALTAEDKSLEGRSRIRVWVYDPFADSWTRLPVSESSPLVPGFSAMSREPFQYDPIHNAFILVIPRGITGSNGRVETWGYRYKRAQTTIDRTPPAPPARLTVR